jgi:hypothetical protein
MRAGASRPRLTVVFGETMKSLTLRSSIALACALSVAGCGGGSGNLLLAGSVQGLNRDGLILQNGSEELAVPNGSSTFSFTQLLGNDQDFEVKVKQNPSAATCSVTNGKGRTSTFNITSVIVTCVTFAYDIGGEVKGLAGATGPLVLVNGQDRMTIMTDGPFTMTPVTNPVAAAEPNYAPGRVLVGLPYGVSVLTQPTGRTCTVTNGSNLMPESNVDTIKVKCV